MTSGASTSGADPTDEQSLEDYLQEQRAKVPPMLYLPTTGRGDGRFAEIEMRRMNDGRTALLAYTAMDRLMDLCGAAQPWVLMETARLGELEQTQPYDVIFLDMELPAEVRHPDPADETGPTADEGGARTDG